MGRKFVTIGVIALVTPLATGCGAFKRFAYEGLGRDHWQQPEEVIRALDIRPGEAIADLGAGGGYFTFRLADAAGPSGKVYAVDVDTDMTRYLAERAKTQDYQNIDIIVGDYHDPRLPENGVDLIFTSNTYHHIQEREAYFKNVKHYLRSNGRVAVIDFSNKSWFAKLFGHHTSAEEIRSEMEAAGFVLQRDYDFLSRQHFLIFSKHGE